jgi:hypothetical protein
MKNNLAVLEFLSWAQTDKWGKCLTGALEAYEGEYNI